MSDHYIDKRIRHYGNSKITEQTKIREVLQQAALLGLERHGFFEKAAFYGGTALRILHGLDRFSEDLDFTLLKVDEQFDFSFYLEAMRRELEAFGFHMEIVRKIKNIETTVHSAFLKMNTIELYLVLGDESKRGLHPEEKIQIKVEVDTTPPPYFRTENRLVTNPMPFYVLTLQLSDLFSGKMHAILYRAWKGRIKGRDWYDLIWYIQKKIPLGLRYLQELMEQTRNLPPKDKLNRDKVQALLQQKIQTIDWEMAKADVRPFIHDPEKLDIWSSHFFEDLIQHLIVE